MLIATEIITPLGTGVLHFQRMTAREELGRLSEFPVDLYPRFRGRLLPLSFMETKL